MSESNAAEACVGSQSSTGSRQSARHTSIIYFHGMGTPKRYEELSRVIDTLDRYAGVEVDNKIGVLRSQKVGLEPLRVCQEESVAYLRFSRFVKTSKGKDSQAGSFRLYESYWSPAAAGAISALGVLVWILLRSLNPFAVLAKPWRAHQRLKFTYLNRMFYDRGSIPARRYRRLATLYREFEGMADRRRYPRGSFADFKQLIRDSHRSDDRETADLLALADKWRSSMRSSQANVVIFSASVAASIFGLATLALYLIAFSFDRFGFQHPWIAAILARAGEVPALVAAIGALVLITVCWGGALFLRNFLSDVVFWTTTFEKDVRYRKRREILRACEDTMRHVLLDPLCERVVIVAHSLGTAIAYETLLRLGRRVASERQAGLEPSNLDQALGKITHLISLGSPIDRINYFFNLTDSRYHRFNRVADALLGSTSDPPFRSPGRRPIQWLNVRDQSDPISSRLFSPRGSLPNRKDIQEISISSSHVPNPATAHTGYFSSLLAAKVLFDACILNRGQVQLQDKRPLVSRRVAEWGRLIALWAACGLAWCLALGAVGFWLDSPATQSSAQIALLGCIGLITVSAAVGLIFDRLVRLTHKP